MSTLESQLASNGISVSPEALGEVCDWLRKHGFKHICELEEAELQSLSGWDSLPLALAAKLDRFIKGEFVLGSTPHVTKRRRVWPGRLLKAALAQDTSEPSCLLSQIQGRVKDASRFQCFPSEAKGPKQAHDRVAQQWESSASRLQWLENARSQAIIGSAPLSLQSILSGLKCWMGFADKALNQKGCELPPSTDAGARSFAITAHSPTMWAM